MKSTRVNEIDLLRFLAALSIVFYHYTFRGYAADDMSVMPYPLLVPFSKYGYLGVNLFFMISGFVILMTAGSGDLKTFVVSRIVRLYPAFWACCTITFVVTAAIGAPRYSAEINQYLINMTMLSGFFEIPSIDGAYWSLFVEMQFYALVAVVLIIGKIHKAQGFLIIWLIATIALEIIPIGRLRNLLIVDYSAYFIAGATFFLIWSQGISITRVGMVILSWALSLFGSFGHLPEFEKYYSINMSGFVVAGIITTFYFVMLLISIKKTGFFGSNRWLLAGILTYPLYLLHQNIGYMIFNAAYPTINPHLLLFCTISCVLGAAYVVHVLVEKQISLLMKFAINDLLDAIRYQYQKYILK